MSAIARANLGTADLTLVLGGGGVWGIAWMTGVLAGFADRGMDFDGADVIGTSAGSVIAAQRASGLSLAELFERQTDPAKQARELQPAEDCLAAITEVTRRAWASDRERLIAVRSVVQDTATVSLAERCASVADRLKPLGDAWPSSRLRVTALDLDTLDLRVFDAGSGVSLIDAVCASCAVPGVWPPVPIEGRLYVDGGVWRTAENAQLAMGADRVLILSPMGSKATGPQEQPSLFAADITRLRTSGAEVVIVTPDEASVATMSAGPLDPRTRAPAARAGREQVRGRQPGF